MLEILITIFIIILIPVYWKNYGPTNFLWLSDIGLFLTFFALWLKSPLLISMAVVGLFPLELAWNIDFFVHLLTGKNLINLAGYMFESKYSNFLKFLSLFHVPLPIIWIYYLNKWGYDTNAFKYMTFFYWIIILSTYFLTKIKDNINWVFLPKVNKIKWMPEIAWLAILMLGIPIFIFFPMHLLLKQIL